jgi:peptide/nickel transport system ATP-binding protein
VMSQGRLVDQGATEDVFGRPGSEYTRRLLEDMPGRLVPQAEVQARAVSL